MAILMFKEHLFVKCRVTAYADMEDYFFRIVLSIQKMCWSMGIYLYFINHKIIYSTLVIFFG